MKPSQVLFVWVFEVKNIGSTDVANFALDYITPCSTIISPSIEHTISKYTQYV